MENNKQNSSPVIRGSTNEEILAEIRALPDDTEKLDLSGKPLSGLAGVKLPSGLRFLNLSDTMLTSLEGVTLPNGLVELNLSGTSLTSLDGVILPQMLHDLYLNNSGVKSLAGVKFPEGLYHLMLGGVDIADLSDVEFPKGLSWLYLGGMPLTSLTGVEFPDGLIALALDYTQLTSLQGVQLPAKLRELWLDGTNLTQLPQSLKCMRDLKTLNLRGMKLDDLPDWLPELNLPFTRKQFGNGICLHNTVVEGVDMSIFDQSQETILQWFEDQKQGVAPLNEIKVVFLGNGDVGKSHTIARLMKDGAKLGKSHNSQSTPGIAISDKSYRIDWQDIRVHFWDFGGQEILYSMHRMFLTERTIYVIMVDARNENKGNQAREWLDSVKSFAGNAPVLLVVNKTDQNPGVDLDRRGLMEAYPNLKNIIFMSAKEMRKQDFNKTFTNAMLELIRQSPVPKMKWPKNWKRVKDALQNMEEPYIRSSEYEHICQQCEVDKEQNGLLNWCNDLGVCFRREDDELRDYVILRPEWITNAVYAILFNKRDTVHNGLISHRDIYNLLTTDEGRRVQQEIPYTWSDMNYILDVVRKFSLSYPVDHRQEFFPMLCSENSSPLVQEYAEAEDTLEFHMEFDYLPNNVLHRLMVECHHELDSNHVWRTGALFRQKDAGLSAVVTTDSKELTLYIRSNDSKLHAPNTYLSVIEGFVDRICKELKLEISKKWLIYKVGGKRHPFDYKELLQMLDDGIETAYATSLDRPYRNPKIEEILKQLAPAEVTEQERLLAQLVKICTDLQATKLYWGTHEDIRNTFLGTVLRYLPYTVLDQTRRGISATGKSDGELDLDIRKFKDIPWTICEALRVEGVEKTDWNDHLDKLMVNYNPNGLRFLILLTYVDDVNNRFDAIWKGFKAHIRDYAPDGFKVVPNSFHHYTAGSWTDPQYIKTARCEYARGDYQPTVYHIFVRMGH